MQKFCDQDWDTRRGPTCGQPKGAQSTSKQQKTGKYSKMDKEIGRGCMWRKWKRENMPEAGRERGVKASCYDFTLRFFYSIHISLRFRFTGLTLPDNIQSKQLNVFDCISLSWSFDRSYSVLPCAHLDVFQCIPSFHWASGCVLQSVANIWWVSAEFHNKCTLHTSSRATGQRGRSCTKCVRQHRELFLIFCCWFWAS